MSGEPKKPAPPPWWSDHVEGPNADGKFSTETEELRHRAGELLTEARLVAEQRAVTEQARQLKALYEALLAQGFTAEQALSILAKKV